MRLWLILALALLLSARADALVLDSVDQTPTTSPPTPASEDPGWNHVGRIVATTGIYLGNGWVLTAAHVGTADPQFQSVIYPVVPGSDVQFHNPDPPYALVDLKAFRIDPSPNLPLLKIRDTTPPDNASLTMIGRGFWRGATTSWSGHDGYLWSGVMGMRWGTNRVATPGSGFVSGNWTFWTDFTKVSLGGTTHEAQAATGDSGGAVFIKNGGTWELAGVLFAVFPYEGQPDQTALYGNYTFAIDLAVYRDQLIEVTRPECANEVDDDGDDLVDWPDDPGCTSELDDTELPDQDLDGVGDPEDNCLLLANPDQRDTNLDGYGNLCDGDFDDDGAVGPGDFVSFSQAYLTGQGDPGYDPDIDLDGNGAITPTDFGLFSPMYLGFPGPSGLWCAGSIPCP